MSSDGQENRNDIDFPDNNVCSSSKIKGPTMEVPEDVRIQMQQMQPQIQQLIKNQKKTSFRHLED